MNRNRALLLVILITWIGLPVPSAFAHTGLVSSTPGAGDRLTVLPSQVKVEFEENLLNLGDAKPNVLVVRGTDGVQVDKSDSKISGRSIFVNLYPSSAVGTFTVSWRVVSVDGHPVSGRYQFSVASRLQATPVGSASASLASAPLAPRTAETSTKKESESFWNQYESRILLASAFLVAILIWARFRVLEKTGKGQGGPEGL